MGLGVIVAWHRHGAEEHSPHFHGGASPQHAHGVLHLLGITGQGDSATISACEAELLLGHPQELTKDRRAEEHQWHLDPHAISGVHYLVAVAIDEYDVLHGPSVCSADVDDNQVNYTKPKTASGSACMFFRSYKQQI